MADGGGSQEQLSAEGNLLHALATLDRSMGKIAEVEPENMMDLFASIRLQIENIEAKVDHIAPERPEGYDEVDRKSELKDKKEDWPDYWVKMKRAEINHSPPSDAAESRKYMAGRLKAVYGLLSRKGIYQMKGVKEAEDEVIEIGQE